MISIVLQKCLKCDRISGTFDLPLDRSLGTLAKDSGQGKRTPLQKGSIQLLQTISHSHDRG
ncbi:MAG: hypothetical protein C4288_00250 [Leptolyngbya sp. ERB_1_1]